MKLKFLPVISAILVSQAFSAVDGGTITSLDVEEAASDEQLRATLYVDGELTVEHPTDALQTCTLITHNKLTLGLARFAKVKGYRVNIDYSTGAEASECIVDQLTLSERIEETP